MVNFSCEKRNEMIGAIKFGATFDQVSAKYGCQERTVKNTWQRYLSTGSVPDRHRPGRRKIFSVRSERRIVRKHKENPFLTAVESGDQRAVSRFTVLVHEVVHFLQSYPEVWIFQQHNAFPHSG